MRHARAERLLSEYLDGALSTRHARALEAHLLHCEACRVELGALRRTRSLLRGLRGVENAPDLAAVVMARIESGEGGTSSLERVRARTAQWFAGPWMAPLATAAVGLALLALVPPIEVEVRIPAGVAAATRGPVASASRPRPVTPLASRRVTETLAPPMLERPQRLPIASFDCWERPSFEACQEQGRTLMNLALHDTPGFLARLDGVSASARERWLGELSRRAALDGSARSVAERLRASDDPRAWQMAPHFESAGFDRR